jgi:Tol biopolymer transport system component
MQEIRSMRLLPTILIAAALAAPLPAQTPGAVALRAAIETETVKGDLKSALQQYAEIAAKYAKSDRTAAASALVHMAECHEKMGDADSRKIYERVVREYADQREAARKAQIRLAPSRRAELAVDGMVSRQVWSGPGVTFGGTVSPDGRYLSHTNWDTGELAVHDFLTGKDRDVTKQDAPAGSKNYPEESAISRDGKHIAVMWYRDRDRRYDLRLVDLSGGEPVKPRSLVDNDDVTWIAPFDWSPDGAWIAVQVQRKDRTTQIALVSAASGQVRVLKSVEWRGATKLLFSPDGKYLAYDLPADENTDQHDIFLMSADASTDTVLLKHPADDTVLAWTPDGAHLLFTSNRSGSNAIWALAVKKGKANDAPILVRPDIGNAHALGLSQSGALFLAQRMGGSDIYIANVDFQTGKLLGTPQKPIQQFVGNNYQPSFSPDGKYLAYFSARDRSPSTSRGAPPALVILSLETGQAHDLRPDLTSFDRLDWAPGSRSLAVRGDDKKGRHGIFQIDIQSGAVSPLVLKEGIYSPLRSRDGKRLYYWIGDRDGPGIRSVDLATGDDREVLQTKSFAPGLSPDGTQFGMYGQNRKSLMTASVEGGAEREVLNLDKIGPRFTGVALHWTPDGKSLVAPRWATDSTQELWRIPVDGGAPIRLELTPAPNSGGFSLHPDGGRVAYTAGRGSREVWVLENFLSSLKASK